MKKSYMIWLIVSVVVLVAGIAMVFANINDVTHYYYKGNLLLDSNGYEDFKMQVNNRGIKVRPNDIEAMAPDPKMGHQQLYLVVFNLEATKDFGYGKPEIVTKESNCTIKTLQIVFIVLGSVSTCAWLCCYFCKDKCKCFTC